MTNQAIAIVSRIEDYLMACAQQSIEQDDDLRMRAVFQAQLIMKMACGDERYTLASIMEVE